jgi:hypothetical protein
MECVCKIMYMSTETKSVLLGFYRFLVLAGLSFASFIGTRVYNKVEDTYNFVNKQEIKNQTYDAYGDQIKDLTQKYYRMYYGNISRDTRQDSTRSTQGSF